jgi:hypothetical protein
VDHDRDNGLQGVVSNRQPLSVGLRDGKAAAGVPQHPGGEVDADRGPAQLADLGGMDAGAAPDLQAGAAALAEEVAQDVAEVEGVAVACPGPGALPAEKLFLVPVCDVVVCRGRRHRLSPLLRCVNSRVRLLSRWGFRRIGKRRGDASWHLRH